MGGDKRDSDVTFKKKKRRKKMAHDSTDSSTEYLSDDESKPKRKRQRIKNEFSSDKIISNQKTNETVPDRSKLLQKEQKDKPITKVKKPKPAFLTMKLSESELSGESEDKQKAERR